MKVTCINNEGVEEYLTKGRTYEILVENQYENFLEGQLTKNISVVDDIGFYGRVFKANRFRKPDELPQPISIERHKELYDMGYEDGKHLSLNGYVSELNPETVTTEEYKSYTKGWNAALDEYDRIEGR